MRINLKSIEAKLVIGFLFVSILSSVLSSYFSWLSIQQQLLYYEVSALSPRETTLSFEKGKTTLLEKGVVPAELQRFLTQSKVKAVGFLVKTPRGTSAFWVTKQEATLLIRELSFDLFRWVTTAGIFLFFALMGVAVLCSLFVYGIAYRSLIPLRQLRRTTDDILAGRFEIQSNKGATGEIKTIFNALEKLCHELEEKHKALGNASALATVDGLTSLKNHRALKEAMGKALASLPTSREDFCFLILDVDHFKKFNDTYGHQQGDEVLKTVGRVLRETARSGDFVARYGGEEFAAILPRTSPDTFFEMAEKIRNAIMAARVLRLDGGKDLLKVTVSVGGVCVQGAQLAGSDFPTLIAVIERADKNLYLAKQKGRNNSITSLWTEKN